MRTILLAARLGRAQECFATNNFTGKPATGNAVLHGASRRLAKQHGVILQASPLETAELHVTVAQAIQAVFCMYLRLHGTSPEEHPISREEVGSNADLAVPAVVQHKARRATPVIMQPVAQDRIARFVRKLSKVKSENLLKNSQRATEVNIQAANRFITAAIPELSVEQKQALRQVGNWP